MNNINDFIETLSDLFKSNEKKILKFAQIAYKNSDCFPCSNILLNLFIRENIGKFDDDLPEQIMYFLSKQFDKLQTDNPFFYNMLEKKIKSVNVCKLVAYVSPFLVKFVSEKNYFENSFVNEKFLNFLFMISINALTNPMMQKYYIIKENLSKVE